MSESVFPVYEFRPDYLTDSESLLRFNDGQWTPYKNEFDMAFVDLRRSTAYYVSLPYQSNIEWTWCKNGMWGATVNRHPGGNAWHYQLSRGDKWESWSGRSTHLNQKVGQQAMDYVASFAGCANGRNVELNVRDKTIQHGLLRTKETKEIVTIPAVFNCVYCGSIQWRKEEES